MSTMIQDSQAANSTFRYPVVGALILAATVSFLLGRGTALAIRSASPPPQPQATGALAAQTPPWAEDGFRDGETAGATCVTPDCNG
jgi:hypothetical protein